MDIFQAAKVALEKGGGIKCRVMEGMEMWVRPSTEMGSGLLALKLVGGRLGLVKEHWVPTGSDLTREDWEPFDMKPVAVASKTDGFVQIGVTALRHPVTGDFLPAVPLYIKEEDAEKETVADDGTDGALHALQNDLAEGMRRYMQVCKAAKAKAKAKAKASDQN